VIDGIDEAQVAVGNFGKARGGPDAADHARSLRERR
jgi:hypothetical protein